jgi:hypothetical protein
VTQDGKPANLGVSLEVDRQKPKRDLRISCLGFLNYPLSTFNTTPEVADHGVERYIYFEDKLSVHKRCLLCYSVQIILNSLSTSKDTDLTITGVMLLKEIFTL